MKKDAANSKAKVDSATPAVESTGRGNKDRRREILDVAARLFATQGFHGTSMDEIAREMGMLKGSLYYWIDSKEELLKGVLGDAITQTIADAEAIEQSEGTASDRLRELMKSHIDSWIRNPNNFSVFVNQDYRNLPRADMRALGGDRAKLEAVYKRVIEAGIASGEFKLDPKDATIAVNAIFGMTNWFPRWYKSRGWASPQHIADVMAEIAINGLLGRPESRSTSK